VTAPRAPSLHALAHHVQLGELLKADGKDIDSVLDFQIPDALLMERITGRWIHKDSGRSYHVKFNPPKVPGKDDVTGEPLIQRSDDKPETVGKRLEQFHAQTAPVLDFYRCAL
jgi:adenylate kinase